MNKEKFDNIERNRYYGVRVGDIVNLKFIPGKKECLAEVIEYGFMDNNAVIVKTEDGKEFKWTAEWCEIITKVEDKNNNKLKNIKYNFNDYIEWHNSLDDKEKYFIQEIAQKFANHIRLEFKYGQRFEGDLTGYHKFLNNLFEKSKVK